jgi:hypothetical protein
MYTINPPTPSSNTQCGWCDAACSSCIGPGSTNCMACSVGFFLSGTTCNATCPPGTYQNNQARTCIGCSQPVCNNTPGRYLQVCAGSTDSFCANCSTCGGQAVTQPCSFSSNTVCAATADASRSASSTGIGAGAAGGGVLLLLLAVLLVLFLKRVRLQSPAWGFFFSDFVCLFFVDFVFFSLPHLRQLSDRPATLAHEEPPSARRHKPRLLWFVCWSWLLCISGPRSVLMFSDCQWMARLLK